MLLHSRKQEWRRLLFQIHKYTPLRLWVKFVAITPRTPLSPYLSPLAFIVEFNIDCLICLRFKDMISNLIECGVHVFLSTPPFFSGTKARHEDSRYWFNCHCRTFSAIFPLGPPMQRSLAYDSHVRFCNEIRQTGHNIHFCTRTSPPLACLVSRTSTKFFSDSWTAA